VLDGCILAVSILYSFRGFFVYFPFMYNAIHNIDKLYIINGYTGE
jgi:hypothetical protein